MSWTLLIISLGSDQATARMRAWRGLKALGAAVLRDGVYLLPARDALQPALQAVADDVRASGGAAFRLLADGPDAAGFARLFDRTPEFGELMAQIGRAQASLGGTGDASADTDADGKTTTAAAQDGLKQARKLRKAFAQWVALDFFPGEAQRQCEAALQSLERAAQRAASPGEPQAIDRAVPRLKLSAYRNRTWATRARPWVDRLASAWLIRRFIDPGARLLWLPDAGACPAGALGFDFDGARFSHVGARVTFETLLASFGLGTPALQRLGALVHYLDVGGIPPAEAPGIERLLGGLRGAITNDDALLAAAGTVFDGLLAAFEKDPAL